MSYISLWNNMTSLNNVKKCYLFISPWTASANGRQTRYLWLNTNLWQYMPFSQNFYTHSLVVSVGKNTVKHCHLLAIKDMSTQQLPHPEKHTEFTAAFRLRYAFPISGCSFCQRRFLLAPLLMSSFLSCYFSLTSFHPLHFITMDTHFISSVWHGSQWLNCLGEFVRVSMLRSAIFLTVSHFNALLG